MFPLRRHVRRTLPPLLHPRPFPLTHHIFPPPPPSPTPRFRRSLWSLSAVPPLLLAPTVFAGLVLTLWTYKCAMMVLFQDKIIYMPGIPFGARRETIEDYRALCRGIRWRQERSLRTEDGKVLAAAVATVGGDGGGGTAETSRGHTKEAVRRREAEKEEEEEGTDHVVVVYFQGNGSSTPPRLPFLSDVLSQLAILEPHTKYTLYAPSYRGYWTSTGRPSQRGIERDLAAIFAHLRTRFPSATLVLWGQSIGCGILFRGLAQHLTSAASSRASARTLRLAGLILETPFTSVGDMLKVLYPQRWLPYRYLGVFLWNWWDLPEAARTVSSRTAVAGDGAGGEASGSGQETGALVRKVLLLKAERDELVPSELSEEVERVLREDLAADVSCVAVRGALHTECLAKTQGRQAVVRFLRELAPAPGEGRAASLAGVRRMQ